MGWYDASINPPNNTNDVLVTDGCGSFAVAWYSGSGVWQASTDMLDAENHSGRCSISLDANDVKLWSKIDIEAIPIL